MMFGTAARLAAVTSAGALVVGLAAAPSAAADAVLSPAYGPVGTVVTITGSGLTGAQDVTFNGVHAGAPTVVDDAHLRSTVPTGATSGPVVVTAADDSAIAAGSFAVQRPTSSTITRSARIVKYPGTVVLRAVSTSAGTAMAGQSARLQHARIGTDAWHGIGLLKNTGNRGAVQWTIAPLRSMVYRVVFRPTSTQLGNASPRIRVYVSPVVGFSAPSVAPILTTLRFRGTVRPAPAAGPVYLDQRRDGGWHRVKRATRTRRGHYAVAVSLRATGTYTYRMRRPADATHLAAVSRTLHVVAVNRALRQGMSGPDVLALQKRLRALHYDVGAVNGSFGFDTFHAVIAFEKVQRVTRDGVVGPSV